MPTSKQLARVAGKLCAALRARIIADDPITFDQQSLLAELRRLETDFGTIRVAWSKRTLSVCTTAVKLKEVYLGPFAIQLAWYRLPRQRDVGCFNIISLEPNPAARAPGVTHPHVKDECLCADMIGQSLASAPRPGPAGGCLPLDPDCSDQLQPEPIVCPFGALASCHLSRLRPSRGR